MKAIQHNIHQTDDVRVTLHAPDGLNFVHLVRFGHALERFQHPLGGKVAVQLAVAYLQHLRERTLADLRNVFVFCGMRNPRQWSEYAF